MINKAPSNKKGAVLLSIAINPVKEGERMFEMLTIAIDALKSYAECTDGCTCSRAERALDIISNMSGGLFK